MTEKQNDIISAACLVAALAALLLAQGCGGAASETVDEAGLNVRLDGEITMGEGLTARVDVDGWCRWVAGGGMTCVDWAPLGFDGELVVMPYIRVMGTFYAPSIALGVEALPGSVDWDARGCVMLGPMGWCPWEAGSEDDEGSGDAGD